MLFQAVPQTVNDIRAFCARFNEGIRVEYKSTFDENVRHALPKVVSSFANSLGGVIIVGVNTVNGEPQVPIEGFVPPAEELVLKFSTGKPENRRGAGKRPAKGLGTSRPCFLFLGLSPGLRSSCLRGGLGRLGCDPLALGRS